MSASENREQEVKSPQALRQNFAQDQGEFEHRLNLVERNAVLRTGLSVTLLVVTGLGLFLYSLQQAHKADLVAKESREDALKYAEETRKYQAQIQELNIAISNSREAVQYVTQGINFYHAGNYGAAVEAYDNALRLDPSNPYVLDLRGYSVFKRKDLKGAISAFQESITAKPGYAWGYFDLARAYCADQKYDLAEQNIQKALQLRPGLRQSMGADGEFLRLCAPLKQIFFQPTPPPHESPSTNSTPGTDTKSRKQKTTGCHDSMKFRRMNGEIPDLESIKDALLDRVCDLADADFSGAEGSITFKIMFEIREVGFVANYSVQNSSGNPQFDAAVRKAVEETKFPRLVGAYRLGTPIQVILEMSYASKSGA